MKVNKSQVLDFEAYLARFVNTDNVKSALLKILEDFKSGELKSEEAIEGIESFYARSSDGGLSWGFGRNAVIIKNYSKTIREELALVTPSDALKKYEDERVAYLLANASVPDDVKFKYVEDLKDKHSVRQELTDRIAKLNEILLEEIDVPLYRISKQKVSGMRDGDDPSKCVLTMKDSAYLQDLGILYDPEDEKQE